MAVLVVAVVVTGWGAPTVAQDGGSIGGVVVSRVAGGDRVETAVAISQMAFASAPAAVLARADDGADALVGAPLAYELGGPILLVSGDEVPGSVAAELRRLGVGEVVVLGGPGAISRRVEERLAADYRVRRVAGGDRFGTAAAISRLLPSPSRPFLAASSSDGSHNPDALAAGVLAALYSRPILLVERDGLPASTQAALLELDERARARRGEDAVTLIAYVVGGTHAVSDAVEERLVRNEGGVGRRQVMRIAGADRFETAALLYDEALEPSVNLDASVRWLASGSSLDALAAGPAIAALGQTLLLVDGEDLGAQRAVVDRLRGHRDLLERVVLVGGEAVIGADAEQELRGVLLQDDLDAPRCPAEQLRGALQSADGATGSQYQSVELVNVGEDVCTLEGRASVQLLDAEGRPLKTSVWYTEDEVATVPLAPRGRSSVRNGPQPGQAAVSLSYRTQDSDTCGPSNTERVVTATAVEIGLPSGGRVTAPAFDDSVDVRTCEGRLTVTPILDADVAFG